MITIGRLPTNDIQLIDETVSGNAHLKVEVKPNGKMIFYHNGTNDTKVNGISIKKSTIDPDDKVQIGDFKISGINLLRKINQIAFKSRTDFTKEFELLLPVYEEYEIKKNAIEKPSPIPKMIKVGLSLSVVMILIFFTDHIPEGSRYALIAGAGVIATIFSGIGTGKKSKKKKIDDLNLRYEDDIRCPKCRVPMHRKSSYVWKSKGRCINDNCDVEFSINEN
jgi:pSer/pThr/pTyr-binding forkhead associated (FHA) protein